MKMRAVVYERYGPPEVLWIKEVEKPIPADDQILVKICAATVAAGDWRMRKPEPMAARLFNGLFRPLKIKILGFELAGEVEAAGKDIQRFRKGDPVFAFTGFGFGAHAEYICLREEGPVEKAGLVAFKPTNLTHQQAAALPAGGSTALAFLRKGNLNADQHVLIYGASGSVGTYAVQLTKHHFGAAVTGICSASNLELVSSLGAERVIDYTQEGWAKIEPVYDLVFDAVGKLSPPLGKRLLKKNGVFLSVNGSAHLQKDDLETLKSLAEAEKIKPVIDRYYSLEEIVEAHRYVERGHKKGNVVITIADSDSA